MIFYEPETATTSTTNLFAVIRAGGVVLGARYYQDAGDVPNYALPGDEPVVVRGEPGRHVELRRDRGGNTNARYLRWQAPAQGGGILLFTLIVHPDVFNKAAALQVGDRLSNFG